MREINSEVVCRAFDPVVQKYSTLTVSVRIEQTEKGPAIGISGGAHAIGLAGQIVEHLRQMKFSEFRDGWTAEKLETLLDVWEKYHNNDLRAGTPAQMAIVRPFIKAHEWPMNSYVYQCAELARHGLLEDGGYRYGTSWLYEPVPDSVIEFLNSL